MKTPTLREFQYATQTRPVRCLCMQGRCVGEGNLREHFHCARIIDIAHSIPPEIRAHDALVTKRDALRARVAELEAALKRIQNIQGGAEPGLTDDADFETVTIKCEEIARAALRGTK